MFSGCTFHVAVGMKETNGYDETQAGGPAMLIPPDSAQYAAAIREYSLLKSQKQSRSKTTKTTKTKPQTKEDDSPQFLMPGSST